MIGRAGAIEIMARSVEARQRHGPTRGGATPRGAILPDGRLCTMPEPHGRSLPPHGAWRRRHALPLAARRQRSHAPIGRAPDGVGTPGFVSVERLARSLASESWSPGPPRGDLPHG